MVGDHARTRTQGHVGADRDQHLGDSHVQGRDEAQGREADHVIGGGRKISLMICTGWLL